MLVIFFFLSNISSWFTCQVVCDDFLHSVTCVIVHSLLRGKVDIVQHKGLLYCLSWCTVGITVEAVTLGEARDAWLNNLKNSIKKTSSRSNHYLSFEKQENKNKLCTKEYVFGKLSVAFVNCVVPFWMEHCPMLVCLCLCLPRRKWLGWWRPWTEVQTYRVCLWVEASQGQLMLHMWPRPQNCSVNWAFDSVF